MKLRRRSDDEQSPWTERTTDVDPTLYQHDWDGVYLSDGPAVRLESALPVRLVSILCVLVKFTAEPLKASQAKYGVELLKFVE